MNPVFNYQVLGLQAFLSTLLSLLRTKPRALSILDKHSTQLSDISPDPQNLVWFISAEDQSQVLMHARQVLYLPLSYITITGLIFFFLWFSYLCGIFSFSASIQFHLVNDYLPFIITRSIAREHKVMPWFCI